MITLAKGLGGGLPIGAMAVTGPFARSLKPGDHASTFGGNYLSCAGGLGVMQELIHNNLLENVKIQGKYLKQKLGALQNQFTFISDVRGCGLMLGLELTIAPKEIVLQCMEEGLLLIGAGKSVIRFVPPLIVKKKEIDNAIEILTNVLHKFQVPDLSSIEVETEV